MSKEKLPSNEKERNKTEVKSREEILGALKDRHLIIKDGYDYTSDEPPKMVPTLFHGTSGWYEDEIRAEGLKPFTEQASLEKVFASVPDLETLYKRLITEKKEYSDRMVVDKNRALIFTTYSYEYALSYTRGSEIIEEYLNEMRFKYRDFMPSDEEIMEVLGDIDTKEKKALASVLRPKPLMLVIKAPVTMLDLEQTKRSWGGGLISEFASNPDARRELRRDIENALKLHRRFMEETERLGITKMTQEEVGPMWTYLQDSINAVGLAEIPQLSMSELIEIYLRSSKKELIFKELPPDVLKAEMIDIAKSNSENVPME